MADDEGEMSDWMALIDAAEAVGFHALILYAPPPEENVVGITFSNDEAYLDAIMDRVWATEEPATRCACGHSRAAHRSTVGEGDPLTHCRAPECGCLTFDDAPDDFRSWCNAYGTDPEGPRAHGLYQDWLDESDE